MIYSKRYVHTKWSEDTLIVIHTDKRSDIPTEILTDILNNICPDIRRDIMSPGIKMQKRERRWEKREG